MPKLEDPIRTCFPNQTESRAMDLSRIYHEMMRRAVERRE
jgi:hypothetical protein